MFRTLRAITHLRGELVSDDRMDCPRVVEREMGAPDDMLAKCGGSSSVRGAHHHDQFRRTKFARSLEQGRVRTYIQPRSLNFFFVSLHYVVFLFFCTSLPTDEANEDALELETCTSPMDASEYWK